MTTHRFPPPWCADKIPGGYVVRDANGQTLVYVYSRDNEAEALQAKVLTKGEGRGARRAPRRAGARQRDWNFRGASRLVDSARLVSCLRANVGQARWPAMAVGLWSAPA